MINARADPVARTRKPTVNEAARRSHATINAGSAEGDKRGSQAMIGN
jgi:2-methylisocitrate lyase-like PEP mutase family enzyme